MSAQERPDPNATGSGIEFSEFVLSLATNAIAHLGGEDSGDEVAPAPDPRLAAQYIDILSMLQEKTAGNLEKEEKALLESVLYDLRMRYLELTSR